MWFFVLLIAVLLIIIYFKYIKKHKEIKSNSILFISGAPKTGKSFLGVYCIFKAYKKNYFKWFVKNTFMKLFKKGEIEKPLLYSNIPLKYKLPFHKYEMSYCLTKEHLEGKARLNYNSCVYIGEWSLVANSRLGQYYGLKNGVDYDIINEKLLFFTKLFGHATHGGGKMVIDSQTISDCHYALKRCLSQYVYIHHNINIPFFKLLFVKECTYSEDNSSIQTNTEDIEDGLKWLIIPKQKIYKMYDYCCYKVLSDDKPLNNVKYKNGVLTTSDIVSFSNYKTLQEEKGGVSNEEKIKKC